MNDKSNDCIGMSLVHFRNLYKKKKKCYLKSKILDEE